MKFNSDKGIYWFATMISINAVAGILCTFFGIITLLSLQTDYLWVFIFGLFCLGNIKTFFELAQNEKE